MHFHTHELNLDFFPFVNVSYVNLINSAKEPRREEKKGFPPHPGYQIHIPHTSLCSIFQILLRFPEHVLLKTKKKEVSLLQR